MTIAEARARVAEIRDAAGDDEAAHCMEDRLRTDALEAVVGANTLQELNDAVVIAAIALSTKRIDFARWCA